MPTNHTQVTIYNMALDLINEPPASSTSDSAATVRWLNRNYGHYVRVALRQQPWNFACELHELEADVTAPAFRWQRQFSLPNGWLRVLPLTHNGCRDGRPVPYEVKSNKLLTDAAAPVRVELVVDHQSPGDWDDLFAAMIAGRLANGMAHKFTGKTSYVELTKRAAEEALETAELINAFESMSMPVEQYDILRVRGDNWS